MEILFGALVSFIVEGLKRKLGTDEWQTLGVLLIVALGAGLFKHLAVEFGFWQSFIEIIAYAGASWAFIIKRFEK